MNANSLSTALDVMEEQMARSVDLVAVLYRIATGIAAF